MIMDSGNQKLKLVGIIGVIVAIVLAIIVISLFNQSNDTAQPLSTDQNAQDQTQTSSDAGEDSSSDVSDGEQDTDVSVDDNNDQEEARMVDDIESAANDISGLQDALLLYMANNSGSLSQATQTFSEIEDIADDLMLEYYSLDNIFYLSVDFDSNDASEELAEVAQTMTLDKVLVWAGHACATDLVATGDDPSSAVVVSNSRSVAIVFMQAGDSTLGCVNV